MLVAAACRDLGQDHPGQLRQAGGDRARQAGAETQVGGLHGQDNQPPGGTVQSDGQPDGVRDAQPVGARTPAAAAASGPPASGSPSRA